MIDLGWLLFPLSPSPLNAQADVIAYNNSQEESGSRLFCWYCLLAAMLLNVVTTFWALKSRPKSLQVLIKLWEKVQLFLPALRLDEDSLQSRIIAIVWLHILSFCVFLSVALLATFQLGWSPQFSTPYPYLSLKTILYIKAGTCLIVVSGILHNSDIWEIFAEFGCIKPCQGRYLSRRSRLFLKRGFHGPAVLITPSFISFNGVVKIFDAIAGVFMWISLVHARAIDGYNAIQQIQAMIGLSFLALSLSDLWGFVLVAAVFYHSKLAIKNYDEHNADLEDKDSDIEDQLSRHIAAIETKQLYEIKNPNDFSLTWRSLPCGMIVQSSTTDKCPNLDQCNEYIKNRGFIIVASGILHREVIKIFAFALNDNIQCLVAVEFDWRSRGSCIQLKCPVKSFLEFFLQKFNAEELFGGKFHCE